MLEGSWLRALAPDGVGPPVVVRGLGPLAQRGELPMHRHREGQLLFADTGLLTLEAPAGLWVVPPQGAVWIPGGVLHRARSSGAARGFVAFVQPLAATGLPTTCSILAVAPFLRALLERIAGLPGDYAPATPHARLLGVLLDELAAAPIEPLHLPMPADPRLHQLATSMRDAPAEHGTLAHWAQRIGMSERNMTRLFTAETGMSVQKWRRQMHVLTVLPLLAQGLSLQAVAEKLGYESAGAFVTMFRKAVGVPPKRFLAARMAAIAAPLQMPAGGR